MSKVTIRKLEPGDVEEFSRIRLLGLLTDPTSFGRNYAEEAARPLSDFSAFLAPSRKRIMWGAFRDDKLIGLIRLERDGPATERTIYSMYVVPEERRRGLARRLLRTAIARAKKSPLAKQVSLFVEASNAPAQRLYRSMGFRKSGMEKDIICVNGRWYSEIIMRKLLQSRRWMTGKQKRVKS